MSNHLAIATVTAALGRIVHTAAESSGVGSVGLEFGRPTAAGDGQGARKVQVYLYQVSPNAALRNADLPNRDSDGNPIGRPRIALVLHYLLAFYGSQQALEPERMLGAVARDLHAHPLLSRGDIQGAIASYPNPNPLEGSDLADAIERVRFTPVPMSLDELSKLWSVFFQTPHALSVVYQANVVLIDAEESGPTALPVLSRGQEDRGLETLPDTRSPFPALEGIHIGIPEDLEAEPLPRSFPAAQLGAFLILRGSNLSGETLEVELRHARYSEPGHPQYLPPKKLTIPPADRSESEVRVTIPNDDAAKTEWRAGPYTLSIVVSSGNETRGTNALPLVLAPRITSISPPSPVARDAAGNVTLTVTADPAILETQAATLLLADREIEVVLRANSAEPLQFVVQDAPVVTDAVVRLRVDRVDSVPFQRTATPPGFRFLDNQKVTIT
jgi:hypothetical protein